MQLSDAIKREDLTCEDEELLAELDLFLAQPEQDEELFLLNYPHRVAGAGIGVDRAIEEFRIRPRHRRVELTVSLLPRIQDESAAYSEKSFDFSEQHMSDRPIGECQKFVSAQPSNRRCNVAAGMYVEPADPEKSQGAFVLAPIRRFARMCPSFEHIDELEAEIQLEKAFAKAARDKERGTLDENIVDEQNNIEEPTNDVQVEMTFTKRETDRSAERRKNSFPYLKQLESEDKWLSLEYAAKDALSAVEKRHRLFLDPAHATHRRTSTVKNEQVEQSGDITSKVSVGSYVDLWYAYAPAADPIHGSRVDAEEIKSGQGSMRTLRRMSPESAVQTMAAHSRVATYETYRNHVNKATSSEDLLRMIRKVAFLLRGCWVSNKPVRASQRFTVHKQPPRLAAARILVLDFFRRSRAVSVSNIMSVAFADMIPPSTAHVERFLSEVAEYQSGTGWVFRLPDDDGFVACHPEIVHEEDMEWENRRSEAEKVMRMATRPRSKSAS